MEQTWTIIDHLCVKCGGRILRCATGNGMTPGGNRIHRCADCGASSTEMGGKNLCWCGMKHKNQSATAYICLPFAVIKDHPEMENVFLKWGCDPKSGEVGVVLKKDAYEIFSPGPGVNKPNGGAFLCE